MKNKSDKIFSVLRRARFMSISTFSLEEGATPIYEGLGVVEVVPEDSENIRFEESGMGKFVTNDLPAIQFRNAIRWTLSGADTIKIEHLRNGAKSPMPLVELRHRGGNEWASIFPHICGQDSYTAFVRCEDSQLHLQWHVVGPAKSQQIQFRYSEDSLRRKDSRAHLSAETHIESL